MNFTPEDALSAVRGATLGELARECEGARVVGDPLVYIRDVRHDSREVSPGDLFVARKGLRDEGERYTGDALARGASGLVTSFDGVFPEGVSGLRVPDPEMALALCSAAVWGHPTWTLDVLGITGTNGKTTTAWLLEHALSSLGAGAGLLGTVEHRYGALRWPALHTTPEADDLTRRFAAMRAAGAEFAVMEVSSHALLLKRVAAVRFRVAALTNVTRDHLDLHGTFESYARVKCSLFESHGPGQSVLNADDPVGAALAAKISGAITYSARGSQATVRALSGGATPHGISVQLGTPEGEVHLVSGLLGAHNVENLLGALCVLGALEYPYVLAAEALRNAPGAPGRLERVRLPGLLQNFEVLVDYAHTPDALARVLGTLRASTPGRLICVFGCGGDRDPGKRALMGAAVGRSADLAIVTTDNPRGEDPMKIAEMALEGLRAVGHSGFELVLDRAEAIGRAVCIAQEGDMVLIAGKGHETWQEVRGVRLSFDDRAEAHRALALRFGQG